MARFLLIIKTDLVGTWVQATATGFQLMQLRQQANFNCNFTSPENVKHHPPTGKLYQLMDAGACSHRCAERLLICMSAFIKTKWSVVRQGEELAN